MPTGQKRVTDGNKFSLTEEVLEKAGILKRFQNVSFESIMQKGLPESREYQDNFKIVQDYVKNLDNNIDKGIGLLFAGNYGTLKTTLAVAILRYQLERGESGMIVPMCSLIDNLFTMRERNKDEWLRYETRLRTTPLLILDDLGAENTDQKWVLAKVDSIITERYNRQKPIIITSNLTKDKLKDTYSGRIIDRLKSTSFFIVFAGESQREKLQ